MSCEFIETEDPLGLETYGYPKICCTARNWIRYSEGWFFPDLHPDEPACYMDIYINRFGECFVYIDYWPNDIAFPFSIDELREDALSGLKWLLGNDHALF